MTDPIAQRHAERDLYHADREAWAKEAAPRWTAMLRAADKPERERLWSIAGKELRRAITNLVQQEKTP